MKVLIISKDSYEYTTDKVIDWLIYYGVSFDRVNGESFENIHGNINISLLDKLQIFIDGKRIKNFYNSIWFRRWSDYEFAAKIKLTAEKLKINSNLSQSIVDNIILNSSALKNIVLNNISSKKQLTTANQITVNKLEVLLLAKKNNLNIPKSIVTNSKHELIKFSRRIKKGIIVKSLDSTFSYVKDNMFYISYTEFIDNDRFNKIPDYFFTSFFQERIVKEYEIRTFFLNDKFYSMAIFSQSNTLTEIDFRKYDNEKPNKVVPYNIPKSLKIKLRKLMLELNLKTGSIDLIKSENGKYYFLEVNPVGQFSNLSEECNYNIEFIISKYLST